MPKRKGASPSRAGSSVASSSKAHITLSSLDAALDMLATDTFTRLDSLICKFESAAGIQVASGQAKARWEEAVKRYWVMRSMEVLSCSGYGAGAGGRGDGGEKNGNGNGSGTRENGMDMEGAGDDSKDDHGRSTSKPYLGPVHKYGLCPDEEQQWRRWSPKIGDVVLVDLPENGVWPGKVIDKKAFYQGRTIPKGYHYFPVRIYSDDIEPCVMIKSRLLPIHIRPSPPLLATEALQSAYHHATSPDTFDALAQARELNAAHCRCHPGVGRDPAEIKREKERWNEQVNWVMNERRAEKMRALAEEREKRLAMITVDPGVSVNENGPTHALRENGSGSGNGSGMDGCWDGGMSQGLSASNGNGDGGGGVMGKKKRKTSIPLPELKKGRSESPLPVNSIFGPAAAIARSASPLSATPRRTSSPALVGVGGIIRPGLGLASSNLARPSSPRRTEKRRSVYSGVGEYSPSRGRGSTWTPPKILPSGDETAPAAYRAAGLGRGRPNGNGVSSSHGNGNGHGYGYGMSEDGIQQSRSSPAPSGTFDFVSPLGPVVSGRLANGHGHGGLAMTAMNGENSGERGTGTQMQRSGSLNGLEAVKEEEGEEEGGWTLVTSASAKRNKGAWGRAGSAPCEGIGNGHGHEGGQVHGDGNNGSQGGAKVGMIDSTSMAMAMVEDMEL